MSLKILIVEDEMIIARFIEQHILSFYQDVQLSIALSVDEVALYMTKNLPDLVLCDIQLNDRLDGIELMTEYSIDQKFAIIFITSYQSKSSIDRATLLSPENYIIKPLDENRLYAGINIVIQRLMQNRHKNIFAENQNQLSPGELQVLKLIAQSHTTKHIAETLCLSPHTIKNIRHRICRKLNLNEENNALLTWAIEHQNLISPPFV